jgi:eukaryotic-like serine/threonine-protein kinase
MQLSGRLLGGRYELLSVLASGGMGQVWRARDTLLQRQVAVKVLRSDVSADRTFLVRFRAEAQHTAALTHPNIAAVFDYGEVPDDGGEHRAYLVMELVEGEPLAALLDRHRRLGAPLTLSILRQIAAALAVAHEAGVVHRDIKPANVLVLPDGLVKVTDFGIASSASSLPLTRTGQVLGTAHYLSPEQAQGEKATPASDVYAAGALGYECLAGRRPFEAENAVQVAVMQIHDVPAPLPPDVPAPVRELVQRAMAKDPAQRYPDGAALRAAVEQVIPVVAPTPEQVRTATLTVPLPLPNRPRPADATAVLPAGARPAEEQRTLVLPGPGQEEQPAPPSRRGRVVVGAVVAALVVLAAVLFGVLHGTGGSPGPSSTRSSPASAPSTTAAPTTPTPTTPPSVQLAAADYTGRPVAAVQQQLAAMGLPVVLKPVQQPGVPTGTVVAIDPSGTVPAGSTVTVSYAAPSSPPPQPKPAPGHGKHPPKKKGGGD